MVSMGDVFCLSTDDELNEDALQAIMASGYSRIPVYAGRDTNHIKGFLLTKRLIVIDIKVRGQKASNSRRQETNCGGIWSKGVEPNQARSSKCPGTKHPRSEA
jgi:CBS domain containing-hemolysin-like protein